LQAVQRHAFADPLAAPGEADLTVHVDFSRIAEAARTERAHVHGPVRQGDFLRTLGIEARAAALRAAASTAQAAGIDAALRRLTGSGADEMGVLFKVLAITHPNLDTVPGLPPHGGPKD
jgi:SAM-dependent MidA family methyltransferase